MKKSFLLSIIVLLFSNYLCQAGWRRISEYPYNNYFYYCSISFATDSIGYLSGFGCIKKTTDGGKNWTGVLKGEGYFFYHKLFVLNKDTLWASGEGIVKRSFDGGASWDSLVVDTTGLNQLYKLKFTKDGHGSAYDYSGIYESDDFGNTWSKLQLPGVSISAFLKNGRDSILFTTSSDIFRSTDNGSTWSFIKKENIKNLHSPQKDVVFALLSDGSVHKSTDWGLHWVESFKKNNPTTPIAIHAFNEHKWFISYSGGILAYTTDGGESWKEPQNKGMFGQIYGAGWSDSTSVYVVGADYCIFKTSDLGESWICMNYSGMCNFSKVQFVDSSHVWSVGGRSASYSTDGGSNWRPTYFNSPVIISNLSFVTDSIGYITDEGGSIIKTTDCGTNWQTYRIEDENSGFGAIHFFTRDTGIVASYFGRIYRTTDGGVSWKYVGEEINPHRINSFFALDNNHVWAAGGYGRIIFSSDRGATWSILPTNTTDYYESVQFIDPMRGWAVGEIGLVASTTDGGYTWRNDTIPSMPLLLNVDFINKDTGWVAGADGYIFVSTDGGHYWHEQNRSTEEDIVCLHMNNDCTGLAFAYSFVILAHRPDSVLVPVDTTTTGVDGEATDRIFVAASRDCNELVVYCSKANLSEMAILGMLGNEIARPKYATRIDSNSYSIDISGLEPGCYFFKARRDGREFVKKFLVAR